MGSGVHDATLTSSSGTPMRACFTSPSSALASGALLGMVLLSSALFTHGASAQQTPHGGGAVPNIGGSDTQKPTVLFTPGTETTGTQTLSVTIQWCDNVSLKSTTRNITFNSVNVTSNFT